MSFLRTHPTTKALSLFRILKRMQIAGDGEPSAAATAGAAQRALELTQPAAA
jgi:hypothetical protein